MTNNPKAILTREETKRELEEKFKPKFDQNESQGGIPLAELANTLNREDTTIPNDQIRLLLQEADLNGDRIITYPEFEEMVLSHPQNKLSKSILSHLRAKTLRWIAPKKYVQDELYISHFNCIPPPWFIPLVSLAITGVFVWYAVLLAKAGTPVTWLTGVPMYSPLIYCPSRRYEAWRFITYAFMHSGYQHIIMNLILQIIIGVPLEWVHKWRVIPIYVGGIIAGSLGQSVCDPAIALVGASGGVYALIGAHFGNIFMNWTEMVDGWDDYPPLGFICSPFFKIPLFLVLVIGDTGIAVIRRWWPSFAGGVGASPVGIGAHIGGLVAGFLLSVAFVKNFKEEPWEKWPFYIVLVLYLLLTLFAVLWNTFYPNYPATDWTSCCNACNT